jgi:hypothetical protein
LFDKPTLSQYASGKLQLAALVWLDFCDTFAHGNPGLEMEHYPWGVFETRYATEGGFLPNMAISCCEGFLYDMQPI